MGHLAVYAVFDSTIGGIFVLEQTVSLSANLSSMAEAMISFDFLVEFDTNLGTSTAACALTIALYDTADNLIKIVVE